MADLNVTLLGKELARRAGLCPRCGEDPDRETAVGEEGHCAWTCAPCYRGVRCNDPPDEEWNGKCPYQTKPYQIGAGANF